jgi:GNAT superfamily N-acetyltransferase
MRPNASGFPARRTSVPNPDSAMSRELTVRAMRPADAPAIIAMARALAAAVGDTEPPLTEDNLLEASGGPHPWFDCLVADAPGRLVGYTLLCRGFEAHTASRRLWIGDFFVEPTARRSGVGRALMAAVARHALKLGCDAVYWELWRMNRAGEAFYRRLGADTATDLAVMRLDKVRLTEMAADN